MVKLPSLYGHADTLSERWWKLSLSPSLSALHVIKLSASSDGQHESLLTRFFRAEVLRTIHLIPGELIRRSRALHDYMVMVIKLWSALARDTLIFSRKIWKWLRVYCAVVHHVFSQQNHRICKEHFVLQKSPQWGVWWSQPLLCTITQWNVVVSLSIQLHTSNEKDT